MILEWWKGNEWLQDRGVGGLSEWLMDDGEISGSGRRLAGVIGWLCCKQCWVNIRLDVTIISSLDLFIFPHTSVTFCTFLSPKYSWYLFSLTLLPLPPHSSLLLLIVFSASFFSLSISEIFCHFCLSVCLSFIGSAWCECPASEETGISLRVRNLTAQIRWHNETWQITAAVQKLTVLSERHWEWAGTKERERERETLRCAMWVFWSNECVGLLCMCMHMGYLKRKLMRLYVHASVYRHWWPVPVLNRLHTVSACVIHCRAYAHVFVGFPKLDIVIISSSSSSSLNPLHSWTSHLIKKIQGG